MSNVLYYGVGGNLGSSGHAERVQLSTHDLSDHLPAETRQEPGLHDRIPAVHLALPTLALLVCSPCHHLICCCDCHRVLQQQKAL